MSFHESVLIQKSVYEECNSRGIKELNGGNQLIHTLCPSLSSVGLYWLAMYKEKNESGRFLIFWWIRLSLL